MYMLRFAPWLDACGQVSGWFRERSDRRALARGVQRDNQVLCNPATGASLDVTCMWLVGTHRAKGTIMCVNAYGSSKCQFYSIMEPLVYLGYRVIMYTMAGFREDHDESRAAVETGICFGQSQVDDLLFLAKHFTARFVDMVGDGRPILLGNSYGCGVVLRALADPAASGRFSAALLLSPLLTILDVSLDINTAASMQKKVGLYLFGQLLGMQFSSSGLRMFQKSPQDLVLPDIPDLPVRLDQVPDIPLYFHVHYRDDMVSPYTSVRLFHSLARRRGRCWLRLYAGNHINAEYTDTTTLKLVYKDLYAWVEHGRHVPSSADVCVELSHGRSCILDPFVNLQPSESFLPVVPAGPTGNDARRPSIGMCTVRARARLRQRVLFLSELLHRHMLPAWLVPLVFAGRPSRLHVRTFQRPHRVVGFPVVWFTVESHLEPHRFFQTYECTFDFVQVAADGSARLMSMGTSSDLNARMLADVIIESECDGVDSPSCVHDEGKDTYRLTLSVTGRLCAYLMLPGDRLYVDLHLVPRRLCTLLHMERDEFPINIHSVHVPYQPMGGH